MRRSEANADADAAGSSETAPAGSEPAVSQPVVSGPAAPEPAAPAPDVAALPAADIALLAALADSPGGVSLPRLAKQLGARASTLMRALAPYGTAPLGGQPGPGWVEIEQDDSGWRVRLTDAGHQALAASEPGRDA